MRDHHPNPWHLGNNWIKKVHSQVGAELTDEDCHEIRQDALTKFIA